MAQTDDFDFANQSGLLFRQQVNAVIAALVSSNSGSTAPDPTFPGMFWLDTSTTPAVLKQRNAANDAWLEISLGLVKPGAVIWHAANTAPTGYLKANGALVSRSTYADLFAAIGTTFGAGDGSTTFALPDLRGEFIRGWDDARGIDSGRAFGSAQTDAFRSHNHDLPTVMGRFTGGGTTGTSGTVVTIGDFQTSSAGGAETRPRNVALLACIKF